MSTDLIIQLGDDQHSSQYIINFPNGIPGGGKADLISLRADQSFDPPEEKVGTYEFWFRGLKIVKPSMIDETEKTMTFDVRIDQQWQVHKDLVKWKKMVHDCVNGTAMDFSQISTSLLVKALDGSGIVKRTFRYGGVALVGLKTTQFEHNNADPSRCTLNMIYQTIKYE
jgi:hypothetical protein